MQNKNMITTGSHFSYIRKYLNPSEDSLEIFIKKKEKVRFF